MCIHPHLRTRDCVFLSQTFTAACTTPYIHILPSCVHTHRWGHVCATYTKAHAEELRAYKHRLVFVPTLPSHEIRPPLCCVFTNNRGTCWKNENCEMKRNGFLNKFTNWYFHCHAVKNFYIGCKQGWFFRHNQVWFYGCLPSIKSLQSMHTFSTECKKGKLKC